MNNCENFELFRKKYNHIYLYGAGNICKYFLNWFGVQFIKEHITAIFVTETLNNDSSIMGIPVIRFDRKILMDDDVVIITVRDADSICRVLDEQKVESFLMYSEVVPDEVIFSRTEIKNWNENVLEYINHFFSERPLFKYIEIETINRCNGECSFCPVNKNMKQRVYHKMTSELFRNIVGQLAEIQYKGLLALFSNNEPFLDDRIEGFAQYARNKLPDAYIYIYTNGSLLNGERVRNIMNYLDYMQIDNYNPKCEKPKSILEAEQVIFENGFGNKYNYFEIEKDAIRFSRGGKSPNSSVYYSLEAQCCLPFVQMVIRPDGKVSLCCNDALGENTLGDLTKEKMVDVWNGSKYDEIRKRITMGRYNLSSCRYCNYIDKREVWGNGSM